MANLEVDELLQWVITLPAQQRASDRSLNSDGCKRNGGYLNKGKKV